MTRKGRLATHKTLVALPGARNRRLGTKKIVQAVLPSYERHGLTWLPICESKIKTETTSVLPDTVTDCTPAYPQVTY